MRGIQVILLFMVVQISQCNETPVRAYDHAYHYFNDQDCAQDEPNCKECLSREGNCEWCSDGQCITQGSDTCPLQHRQTMCTAQIADNAKRRSILTYYDKSLDELGAMDTPVADDSAVNGSMKTVNASVYCGGLTGCDNCTSKEFCVWCQSKQTCQMYYNSSTTEQSCPKRETAYKDQCIYPIGVTPCNKRLPSCKTCLEKDGLCYWCASTEKCTRYPSENFQPDDCPSNDWYYKKCPVVNDLMWVLLPIMAIILIPIIVYLIIWLICCCMRAAGYEPLEPTEPSEKKHPKGIRLKPGSPSNRTDELRRKYDLNNP